MRKGLARRWRAADQYEVVSGAAMAFVFGAISALLAYKFGMTRPTFVFVSIAIFGAGALLSFVDVVRELAFPYGEPTSPSTDDATELSELVDSTIARNVELCDRNDRLGDALCLIEDSTNLQDALNIARAALNTEADIQHTNEKGA